MPVMYYKTPVGIAQITEEDGFISQIHILDGEHELPLPKPRCLKKW
jgi:methylated-DNA-[protein]-cysteine S-methyltransferase